MPRGTNPPNFDRSHFLKFFNPFEILYVLLVSCPQPTEVVWSFYTLITGKT